MKPHVDGQCPVPGCHRLFGSGASRRPIGVDATAVRAAIVAALWLAATPQSRAADRLLDQLSTESGSVVVQFNCPMSYVSNYPLRTGDELRIELQPLPGCPPPTSLGETLPVPQGNLAGLVDVRLDQSLGARRALILHFARTVDFLIRPKPGLTAIEIVLSRRVGRTTVEPANPPPPSSRAPNRALPSAEELAQLTAAARSAMQDRDYDTAIRLYTKLLEYPEHPGRPQAQEYLGLARERKGQLAQAKLEYQEYLNRYPEGTDAEIVRQRLAALVTLDGASKPSSGSPDETRWTVNGSVAQEYRHDQNTVVSNGVTSNGVGESAADSEADLQLHRRGEVYDFRSRIYAGYIAALDSTPGVSNNQFILPQAYVEVDDTRDHWVGRLGRQSQSTGGAYGTFDGAYFGWLLSPGLRVGLAAGAPIQTYDANFSTQRVFANLSAEFLGVRPGLDLSVFAFQENASGVLDARQLGLEARYYQSGHSLVAQLDYDVNFKQLNAATVLASWALPARWVLTGIADHRKSPFLETYNALIGQPTTSLNDLIQQYGLETVHYLAEDRSGSSNTVTIGLQRPVGERLQWGADVNFSRVGELPASVGVPAVPSPGTAFGVSTQLIGGGWLVDGDMDTAGAGYTTQGGAKVESLYTSLRFPVGAAIRVGPRLQLSHTSGSNPNTGATAGWSAGPSLLADWHSRRATVQFEAGYDRSTFNASLPAGVPISPSVPSTPLVNQNTSRLYFSLGYNINF